MRKILFGAVGIILLSCGETGTQTANQSRPKKAWNSANNPSIMDTGFVREQKYVQKFDDLPIKGQLKKRPWSDGYWPSYHGGISYRWYDYQSPEVDRFKYPLIKDKAKLERMDLRILSPSEKFDVFLGRFDFPYTRMERLRTEVLKPGIEIPMWEGLCDAWAPATLFFEEPGPVMMKGKTGLMVPFGSSDIKALLAYFLKQAQAPTRFLGTRCEVDVDKLALRYRRGEISRNEYLEQLEKCSGVNAGAFHIVVANQIGRLNQGFIFDRDPGMEVWNHPVWKFESKVLSDKKTKSKDSAPATVREVEIETQMGYIDEKDESWDKNDYTGEAVMVYHYRVEIDAKGNIIGGLWLDASHPDFAWKQEIPSFQSSEDFQKIKELYEASVGTKIPPHRIHDPEPPRVLPRAVPDHHRHRHHGRSILSRLVHR